MNDVENYTVNFERLTKRVDELRSQESNLKKQQDALNKAFQQGKLSEQQYNKALGQLKQQLASVANSQKQLGKVIDGQKAQIADYKKGINGVGDALGKLGGLGVGGFGEIGNAIKALVGGPMGMLTMAIGAVTALWRSMAQAQEENKKKHDDYVESMRKSMQEQFDFEVRLSLAQGKYNNKLEAYSAKYNELKEQFEDLKEQQRLLESTKKYINSGRRNRDKMKQELNDEIKKVGLTLEEYKKLSSEAKKEKQIEDAQNARDAEKARIEKEKQAKLKAIEDAKQADADALNQLDDLKVKLIADDTERQKAQIELTKRRAIKALEDISRKASEKGKKAAQEAIQILKDLSVRDIMDVDIKALQTKFGTYMQKLGDVMKDELTIGMRKTLSGVSSGTSEESLANLKRHFDTMNATIKDTLASYSKLNNKAYQDADKYAEHVNKLLGIFRNLDEANPMRDLVSAGKAREVSELELEQLKYQKQVEDLLKKTTDEKTKLNKLWKDEQDSIVAITMAEVERMEVAKHQNKTVVNQQLTKSEITYEQYQQKMAEIDADFANSREMLNEKTNKKLELINSNYEKSEINIRKNAEDQKTILAQEYANKRKEIYQKEFNTYIQGVESMSDCLGAFAQLQMATANDESKSDAQRAKAQKKALNLQIAQCYIGMANSLAQGISTATSSSSNWIEMLVAIASTVAAVVTQIAQVKSLMSERNSIKYSTGGEVKGKGSGTSDSIDAKLSNGEYVVRAESAQRNLPLLDSINYGGANSFANQLAFAMAQQPAPVVSVQQIEHVQQNLRQTEVYSHM